MSARSAINEDVVRAWEQRTQEYGAAYWFRAPAETLRDVMDGYAEARQALGKPMDAGLKPRVWRLAAQLAVLAGMTFADVGQQRQGDGWFTVAVECADHASDREVGSWAHAVVAHVAHATGDHDRALREATAAKRLAPSPISVGAVYAEAASAQAHAARGATAQALECLRRCGEAYVRMDESCTRVTAFGYPKPLHQYHRGRVLARLDRPRLARKPLLAALRSCPPGALVPRLAARLELIHCDLRVGYSMEACQQVAAVLAERFDGPGRDTAVGRLVARGAPGRTRDGN